MKIFASDLDGTLLNKNYQSDERINSCVQTIVDHHDQFVIVTGRSINGISNLPFIKNASYSIVMNGAIILDKDFHIIKKTAIDEKIINAIHDKYPNDNVEYISDKYIYMMISKEKYLEEYSKWGLWQKKMSDNADIEHHLAIYKFNCHPKDLHNIVKVNILELDSEKYQEKSEFIQQYASMIDNQPFDAHVLELTSKNISKLNALKYLCERYHWCEDDVYVFGDGGNDVEMLKYFKHSFAPNNASQDAIMAAKEVVESNCDYGIINKIASYLE